MLSTASVALRASSPSSSAYHEPARRAVARTRTILFPALRAGLADAFREPVALRGRARPREHRERRLGVAHRGLVAAGQRVRSSGAEHRDGGAEVGDERHEELPALRRRGEMRETRADALERRG